ITGVARDMLGETLELPSVTVQLAPSMEQGEDGAGERQAAPLHMRADRQRHPVGDPSRILVVTHHLGRGGAQLYLQELLVRLVAGSQFLFTVRAPPPGP